MRSAIVLGCVVLLAACSNPRQEVTSQLAQQVLLPAHQQWHDRNAALVQAVKGFCEGDAERASVAQAFMASQQGWSYLQPLMVGPLSEGNRSWQVQFYPDKRNMVAQQAEALLDSHDPLTQQALDGASVVVQGLTAFEYVLFDDSVELQADKARYCPMLMGIAHHQQGLSGEVMALWEETGGMLAQLTDFPNDRYASAEEALGGVLRVQITGVDVLKKKLGTPMGRLNQGVAQPYQAEAWRSRQSVASLQASLAGAQAVWERVRSLVSDGELAGKIDQAYAETRDKLEALPAPLFELVQDPANQPLLQDLYRSLDTLETLQQAELASDLGIQIGFNANDGD